MVQDLARRRYRNQVINRPFPRVSARQLQAALAAIAGHATRQFTGRAARNVADRVTGTTSRSSNSQVAGVQVLSSTGSAYKKGGKKKMKRKRKAMKVPKQVAKYVKKAIDKSKGKELLPRYDYRICQSGQQTSAVNNVSYNQIAHLTDANMASIMANYGKRISTGNALETINYDEAGYAYSGEFKAKGNFKVHFQIRNNFNYSCELIIYSLIPKQQTSTAPVQNIVDGLDNFDLQDGGLEGSPCYYPSDSKIFRESWTIAKRESIVLTAGGSYDYYFSRPVSYSNSWANTHGLSFQPRHSCVTLMRLVGCVAHDETTSTEVGLASAGIDFVYGEQTVMRGVGSFNQLPHTEKGGAYGTLTTPVQWQVSDPGREAALES